MRLLISYKQLEFLDFSAGIKLNKSVDLRSRHFAFRGACGEPPRRTAPVGSHLSRCSRRTLDSILEFAHARRKCDSIFEESRALRTNQQGYKINYSLHLT
jgi:hypothetical protein